MSARREFWHCLRVNWSVFVCDWSDDWPCTNADCTRDGCARRAALTREPTP